MKRHLTVAWVGVAAAAATLSAGWTQASEPASGRWVATWSAPPMAPGSALTAPRSFENQTVRHVIGATLTPVGSSVFPGFFTPENEAKRQAVNRWIRTSGALDGVIDFDRAVRDPADPTRLLPSYNSGDGVHPNDAGYEAMATAIDLSLLR